MTLSSENETLVARLIASTNASRRLEILEMRRQIEDLTKSTTIADYKPKIINSEILCDELLEAIKSLPEFSSC